MDHETRKIIEKVIAGDDLTRQQSRAVFERIMRGDLSEGAIGALLGAMVNKGECVEELIGAAQAMRANMVRIACTGDCIDTCGTGGDGISTFNVSTTAAIIAASAGAVVAKHGNRSTTRASGSTEVLTLLGIDVEADSQTVERSLAEANIGYLNARKLHPAMKYAAPVRKAMPVRTIFNLLGPLTNPAGAQRQLLGVPSESLVEPIAQALLGLGAVQAWVVHGDDGLCDLTVTSSTTIVEVCHGEIRQFSISPESVGLKKASLDALRIDSPKQSVKIVLEILQGQLGAARDHALLNAGAALVVAGVAKDLGDGVARAAKAIDHGAAMEKLDQWRGIAGISKV